ncbi:MAG: SIS domain-containing protein [Bdellovibrionales bacterium]|nr:SIS domain-containing protein [Bdellovibrionales bacterium]
MEDLFKQILTESASVKSAMAADAKLLGSIASAAKVILDTVSRGGRIYTCGNGGSACDAMHFVEELVARYKGERPGIAAHHLVDPSTLSCWANDYSFASVFERQVETFCTSNDLLVLFSTSGNSENIIRAIEAAKKSSTPTLGLLGKGGGKAKALCEYSIVIPSNDTARIQEAHITLVHAFCEILEQS